MPKAAFLNNIVRREIKPLPLVAVLTLCAWTTLVNLLVWSFIR
jgi:hypothetical protein